MDSPVRCPHLISVNALRLCGGIRVPFESQQMKLMSAEA